MFTKENAASYGQKGGMATYRKYGRDHMIAIGRKGFDRTTSLYFNGCPDSHKNWLASNGLFNYWVQTGLPMRYGVDGRPIYRYTPHPSQSIPF